MAEQIPGQRPKDSKPPEAAAPKRKTQWLPIVAVVGLALVFVVLWPTTPPTGADLAEAEAAAERVSAAELAAAYGENVVAAKARFGDKPVMVTGVIGAIGDNDAGEPWLGLAAEPDPVLVVLEREAATKVAAVKVGDAATALCTEVLEIDSMLRLDGCVLR